MVSILKNKTVCGHKGKTYSTIREYKGIMFISFRTVLLHPFAEYEFNSIERIIKKTSIYVFTENSYAIRLDTFNGIMNDFKAQSIKQS